MNPSDKERLKGELVAAILSAIAFFLIGYSLGVSI